jgi:hypothetical protein
MKVTHALLCATFTASCGGQRPNLPANAITPGTCGAGQVCFNVTVAAPGPIGPTSLYVLWTAPGDKGEPEPVQLASLSGNERSISLPLSDVAPPRAPSQWNMWWGYVFATPIGAPPLPKAAAGVAQMMLVHAAAEWQGQAHLVRGRFPAGVATGTAPYFMRHDGGRFDTFVLARQGSVFDLVFCPVTQPDCQLPMPNPN